MSIGGMATMEAGAFGAAVGFDPEALGTLISYVNMVEFTEDTGRVRTVTEQAADDAIPDLWESDTGANRPVAVLADVNFNGLDTCKSQVGDVLHIESPGQFTSPPPTVMDLSDFTYAMTVRFGTLAAGNSELFTEDYSGSNSTIYVGTAGDLLYWNGSGATSLSATGVFSDDTTYVLVVKRTSGAFLAYLDGVDVTTGSPSEAGSMAAQMLCRASGGDITFAHALQFSEAMALADINTLGQGLTDAVGLSDTWELS